MAVNDSYVQQATGVADGGEFLVEGSAAGTGAAEVFEIGGSAAATVYREIDPGGDGTFEVQVTVEAFDGEFHSQGNELVVSASANSRLRIVNTSGGSSDYYAQGMEVND